MKLRSWFLLPAWVSIVLLFAVPFAIVLAYSFLTRGVYGGIVGPWTAESYRRLFDPLYLANEGKLVAAVAPADAQRVLAAMRDHKYGRNAAIIGEVKKEKPGRVVMTTSIGSHRIVDMLVGDMLPRIC